MFLQTVSIFAVLLQLSTAANITCPLNEEFNECDTACPLDCQSPPPKICTSQCIARCACKPNFIRQAPGASCVSSCEGIPVCGKNEKYSNCATLCPPTCEENTPVACPAICLTGCVCKEGYIRDVKGGKCIPRLQCPQKCQENEYFTRCGSACPGTCSEPVKKCPRKCVIGCFCKSGFILDEKTGKCVRKTECNNSDTSD